MNRTRIANAAVALGLFLLNAWLNGPLFLPGEMPYRGSIEGGYAGMARFVAAHPNPWGWNPFQYCGLPTQFLYLPLLPYVTAALAHLAPGIAPEHLYRIATALFACFAPVSLFFFVLYFTRSRGWAVAAALAFTFFSPAYGLIRQIEKDRGIVQLPWRIQVLAKYGEGPHNAGLAMLPLALAAVWGAATRRGFARIFLAAALLAAICLTNWIAALALAICCALLILASFAGGETGFRVPRAMAAAGLAYLLACFWLTPTFVRTIAFNWPADSFGYKLRGQQEWLLAGLVAGVLVLWGLFRWRRASPYLSFVTMAAFAFGWIAVNFYSGGADTLPESRRYTLEFEMFLLLAVIEWMRLAMRNHNGTVRACAIGSGAVLLLAGGGQALSYATQGWEQWRPRPTEDAVEYRVASWLAGQRPQGRVLASGGLRFRMNSWFELPQVGGGFESGLRNRTPVDLAYRIRTGKGAAPGQEHAIALRELQLLGVEYAVVHGRNSREYYRDFTNAAALEGLPVAYRTEDDTVYRVPFTSLAHVVEGPPLKVAWQGTSALTVGGPVTEGSLVSVQMNGDPGWTARQDGHPIPIERDALGFLLLRPRPASAARIELRYDGTAEQKAMAALSLLAWLGATALLFRRRAARQTATAAK